MSDHEEKCIYFTSYTGVSLPLKLVNKLDVNNMDMRITYFKGSYDELDRLTAVEKIVYGEVEFIHRYEYDDGNSLIKATLISDDEAPRALIYDEQGQAVEQ